MSPEPSMEPDDRLIARVSRSLSLATKYSFNRRHDDGHWCGEIKHDVTFTAEVVLLRQALGLDMSVDGDDMISWMLSEQNRDGSWSWAPGVPGDVSPTVEAYFALKLLGVNPDTGPMCRARQYARGAGGVANVRIFTRIYLAIFGLMPWQSIPELPPELILFPAIGPVNVYRLAAWARLAIIPLLVISHHRPIFPLGNGKSDQNDFLDELWCNPAQKTAPYSPPLRELWKNDLTAFVFSAADRLLALSGGLRTSPTRGYARRKCIKWILAHQEEEGDIGGMFPGMVFSLLALHLEGYKLDAPPVCRGLQALERFAWADSRGKRYQSCKGPVWDSILMTIALRDAGIPSEELSTTVNWIKRRQSLEPTGDWRVFRPQIPAGGFAFFQYVSYFPDADDTSAAIIALVKYDGALRESTAAIQAIEWLLGMQNEDGGWGAFDAGNDYLFWNKAPFSDMDALSDPSTADVTGRVLEAFGILLHDFPRGPPPSLADRMRAACQRAVDYLARTQEPIGAWYGRWGTNYIYGTCSVLCGLAELPAVHKNECGIIRVLVQKAVSWIKARQNPDGGWGETVMSYKDSSLAGQGPSTASQTAWALLGLMTHCPIEDSCVRRGVIYLLDSQTSSENEGESSWPTEYWTGTGFPGAMYLGYTFYSLYFPMMALGKYVQSATRTCV